MKSSIKYYIMACLAWCGAMTTGCTDDMMEEVSDQSSAIVNDFKIEVSAGAPETRLELGQDGLSVMWNPGDKLALVKKDRSIAPIYLNTEIQEKVKKATFFAEVGVPVGEYYVIYNDNEDLEYGNQTSFSTIDEINQNKKLVLWGEINVTKGSSTAAVTLQHLYAKVRVVLKNVPESQDYNIGVYSPKKGFPSYMKFTENGLVSTDENEAIRTHRMHFGDNYYEGSEYSNPDNSAVEKESVLIFPVNLKEEDVYFYVYSTSRYGSGPVECYEFKKSNIEFKAGISYKLELDLNSPTNKTTLNLDTSLEKTYLLTNAADCRAAVYADSRHLKLANDIDFKDQPFFPFQYTDDIDGAGHKLSNIAVDWSVEDKVGLIRSGAHISNLTLENVSFKGKNYVGAFVGYSGTADNCKLIGTSTIEGSGDYVGGIVGCNYFSHYIENKRPIKDVTIGQSCTIKGRNYVGGVVGWLKFHETNYDFSIIPLEKCKSYATVTATGNYAGGIFGRVGGNSDGKPISVRFTNSSYTCSFVKCANEGKVTGKNYIGGIGGELALINENVAKSKLDNIILKQSYSKGDVKGESHVGGILGYCYPSINTCYSMGNIKATTSIVGGIVGQYNNYEEKASRIANCYSLANLTVGDKGYAGGIAGYVSRFSDYSRLCHATIINSYFAGTNPTTSGIVGFSEGFCDVTNCLTTMSSLGTNLGEHIGTDYNKTHYDDIITNSKVSVTSILENKSVINGENAYSDNCWGADVSPYHCVKFDEFILGGIDAPDLGEDTIN